MASTSAIVHVLCALTRSTLNDLALNSCHLVWYRKEVRLALQVSRKNDQDLFCRLNARYKPTPSWWYIVLGVISFVFGIIAIEIGHTGVSFYSVTTPLFSYRFFLLASCMGIHNFTSYCVCLYHSWWYCLGYLEPTSPCEVSICLYCCFVMDE